MTPLSPIRVAFVTAELTPLAKAGGLADVAGALPPVLHELGVDIRVFLPKYNLFSLADLPSTAAPVAVDVPLGAGVERVTVHQTVIPKTDVPLYVIEHDRFLGRHGIYFEKEPIIDGIGEAHRFAFFSRAVAAALKALEWQPDIVHCQDWHTGLLPQLLRVTNPDAPRPTILTIHNLGNQGKWNANEILDFLGLDRVQLPGLAAEAADINFLQQGIRSANLLTTVSRTYAKEILTSEYGEGLENDLRRRTDALSGIVNGIDWDRFNPATDPDIASCYNATTLENKEANKADLQRAVHLPPRSDALVIGLVSRLTNQKGLDLILQAAPEFLHENVQLVILGKGVADVEEQARQLARKFPQAASVTLGFDAPLAQKIYAGADLFLVPSRFEPCGLTQLIAMRYGTLPLVRATGGLKDTVVDVTAHPDSGTGVAFEPYEPAALVEALRRAVALYQHNRASWRQTQLRAMGYDSTWTTAAREYIKLYEAVLKSATLQT